MGDRKKRQFVFTLIRMAATGIAGGIALIASAKKIGEKISENSVEKIAEEDKHEN